MGVVWQIVSPKKNISISLLEQTFQEVNREYFDGLIEISAKEDCVTVYFDKGYGFALWKESARNYGGKIQFGYASPMDYLKEALLDKVAARLACNRQADTGGKWSAEPESECYESYEKYIRQYYQDIMLPFEYAQFLKKLQHCPEKYLPLLERDLRGK